MRQRIVHGTHIDAATPDEVAQIVGKIAAPARPRRIRAPAIIQLDGTGGGQVEVYVVPIGYQFAARRVFLNLDTATDPSTGNVALNVAGKYVAYLRSGTLMEYAVPISPNAAPQIPGVQSWGEQQGPVLQNGEVLEAKAVGLTANARLTVIVEGVIAVADKLVPGEGNGR